MHGMHTSVLTISRNSRSNHSLLIAASEHDSSASFHSSAWKTSGVSNLTRLSLAPQRIRVQKTDWSPSVCPPSSMGLCGRRSKHGLKGFGGKTVSSHSYRTQKVEVCSSKAKVRWQELLRRLKVLAN